VSVFEPINRPDLVDDVYHRIRHAIFVGALAPGERLVEDLLATQLGVSRAPVREALLALERDGLVGSVGKRGRVVALLSARDAWEVYSLRSTLDIMGARLVMREPDNRLFEELEGIVREMQKASLKSDLPTLSALDVQFHEAIIRASGHRRLLRAWQGMSHQIRLLSQQVVDTIYTDSLAIPERHAVLLAAIRGGDADVAAKEIERHIESVMDRVTRVLQGAQDRLAAEARIAGANGSMVAALGTEDSA